MLQITLTLLGYLCLVIPFGWYVYGVAEKKPLFCDVLCTPLDTFLYAVCGIQKIDMDWKRYAIALLVTNAVMVFCGYAVLRTQGLIPWLNPNGIGNMEQSLSFNTIISFMTNTNLQHYSGESGLSFLSQMIVIISLMFTSAATGYAACMAFCRGLAGLPLGNFYVDMVRVHTRVLVPLALVVALALVWQGTPQTMAPNATVKTIEGTKQDIALGPIASLVSIKHLGTNGGGFLGANSSTPQENPTIITNILELYSMMLLPGACIIAFGLMLLHKKRALAPEETATFAVMGGQARTIFMGMGLLFVLGLSACWLAEQAGNPVLERVGLSQSMGNMEGKEVRFGIDQSVLFTTVTTSFTTGTVNNMHDTLTPLGGMVPLLHMMLNVVFGGAGVGLMNMVMYVLLAVFICGLMIGRTPEYLGKKIDNREMKLVALAIIVHPLLVLGFSALAVATEAGRAAITNPGFHGLSQVLYEFSSAAANNGSGFEGLDDNTLFWNLTTGFAMFYGRYIAIVLQLALAGSLLAKRTVGENVGTLRTDTAAFPLIVAVTVLVFAALTFLPALSLGPVAEHVLIWK